MKKRSKYTYLKQSTTCLSLKTRTCLFSRATAVNWTPLDGMSIDSRHLILAGNFCDQIRLPLELKHCKQSSIVATKINFSRRISPTAWNKKVARFYYFGTFTLAWSDNIMESLFISAWTRVDICLKSKSIQRDLVKVKLTRDKLLWESWFAALISDWQPP